MDGGVGDAHSVMEAVALLASGDAGQGSGGAHRRCKRGWRLLAHQPLLLLWSAPAAIVVSASAR